MILYVHTNSDILQEATSKQRGCLYHQRHHSQRTSAWPSKVCKANMSALATDMVTCFKLTV